MAIDLGGGDGGGVAGQRQAELWGLMAGFSKNFLKNNVVGRREAKGEVI